MPVKEDPGCRAYTWSHQADGMQDGMLSIF